MALADFFGTWDVQLTSGTPFGIASHVRIEPMGQDQARIQFEADRNPTVEATYDPTTRALQATTGLTRPTLALYISRYTDSAANYRAIYGLMICEDPRNPTTPWLTVWGADQLPATSPAASTPAPTDPPANDSETTDTASLDANYRVGSTSGSQFGIGSTLKIEQNASRITITDAFGNPVPAPDSLIFDLPTGSLEGTVSQTPPGGTAQSLVHVWSYATFNAKQYLYGLAVQEAFGTDDWPEQAGACGAEEEDPIPTQGSLS